MWDSEGHSDKRLHLHVPVPMVSNMATTKFSVHSFSALGKRLFSAHMNNANSEDFDALARVGK